MARAATAAAATAAAARAATAVARGWAARAVAAAAATGTAAAPAAGSAGSAAGSAAWVEAGFASGTPGTRGRRASTRRTTRTPAERARSAREAPTAALCPARLFRAGARPSRQTQNTTSAKSSSRPGPPRLHRRRGGSDSSRGGRAPDRTSGWARSRQKKSSRLRARRQSPRGLELERMAEAHPTRRCAPWGTALPDGDCSRSGLTLAGARTRVPRGTLDCTSTTDSFRRNLHTINRLRVAR